MKKYILSFAAIFSCLAIPSIPLSAQSVITSRAPLPDDGQQTRNVSTGHESAKAEINFTERANYFAAHPLPHVMRMLENEDDDARPSVIKPYDPSLAHGRGASTHAAYAPHLALLPVSPAPVDTFRATIDGESGIPPDTHGAVGDGYVVTANNDSVKVMTRGGVQVSKMSLDAFWNAVLPGGGSFDPRVFYDVTTDRWYLVTDANGELASSSLLMAVSKTNDPTGAWYEFIVPIGIAGSWLDYPTVGYNKKWIAVGGNPFTISGGASGGAEVYIFNKALLLAGTSATFTQIAEASSFTICPAQCYDTISPNLYAVESWNGTNPAGGQLQLWKISGAVATPAMAVVGQPTSTGYEWNYQGGGGADFAPQVGTANKIQTNDDRIFDLKLVNGYLWCSHNVFTPATGTVTHCSAQWWQFDTVANPIQIGLITDPATTNQNFYYFPAIAVNKYSDVLIGLSTSSALIHVDAAYALHLHTDPTDSTRPIEIYRHGQATYYKTYGGGRDRWGDYSQSCVDTNNINFWTTDETVATGTNVYDTWWAYLCFPPVSTITPAGATVVCAPATVLLNANTGTGLTYQWELGGSFIAGATNSSYTASVTGTYNVLVYNSGNCDSLSLPVGVTINPLPAAIAGTPAVCTGATTSLSDATTGGTWSSVTTTVAGISSTGLVTGAGAGTTVVSYILTATGCGVSVVVTDNATPTATITAGGATTFCSGGNVVLSANTGPFTYQWDLGGSPIAGATNSSYTATLGGNYTVIVSSAAGCGSATSTATTVTVTAGPGATITPAGATSVCAPATVLLNANTGVGITYQWQDGGISIPGATSSSYTATTTGNYDVIVSEGPCIVTSATTAVAIDALPAVTAIGGPTNSVCAFQSITLSDATTGGIWSSGSTSIATVDAVGDVTGVAAGTATISYTVANACGTVTATTAVTANAATAVSSITGSVDVCIGGTSILSDVTASGVWSSVSSAIATVSAGGLLTGVSAGTGIISYAVTNVSGCVSSATVTVNVSSPFTAVITPLGSTTFCPGGYVTLIATSGAGFTYQWQFGGVNIIGATSLTYDASGGGNYTVVVSDPGGCSSTSAGVTVTESTGSVVVPSVSIAASLGTILCTASSPETFTATVVNGGSAPTYQWYVNGVAIATGAAYTYSPANGDVVVCMLTSNAPCASPDTASSSVTMSISPMETPTVTITTIPNHGDSICAGDTVVEYGATSAYGGTDPFYRWTKNGVNIATGPYFIDHSATAGDTIYAKLISNFPCLTVDSVASNIIILHSFASSVNALFVSVSQSSIVSGRVDTFTAIATGAGATPAFQWFINGNPVAGATSYQYITDSLQAGQIVNCEETSSFPCANPHSVFSGGISVTVIPAGVQQAGYGTSHFTLLPNPNNGEFTIGGTTGAPGDGQVTIVMADVVGQTVFNKTVLAINGIVNEQVNVSNMLAAGTYLVTITAGEEHVVFHVVIDK